MELYEKVLKSEHKYKGKIINLRYDDVQLPDGGASVREVVEHPGGVCVLALTDNNEMLMVRQYRVGSQSVLLEIPAGKLEWGEEPYACGYRELREETGYEAEEFFLVQDFYSTPGFTNEHLYLYVAKKLVKKEKSLDEDEFLESVKVPVEELYKMVLNNEIKDAKTIIAILLADRYLKETE